MLKRSVIAVALTLPVAPHVLAQEADKPIQKVIVTGSNIARIDSETTSPIQTIRQQDIKRLGVSSVKELMDTLTSSDRSALSDDGGSNSFAGGASSVSLRALGKQSTLVLLNSRRVAPYPLADYNEVFTNLDSLPLDAVDRVEILRNGGSSIYGSDAVAGVINVITRSDYRGLTISGSFNRSVEQQSIRNGTVSVTGGFGDLDNDRFNVLANVEYFKRNDLFWREVVDDINPTYGEYFGTVAPGSGLMFGNRGTPSTFSFPGNLMGQGPLPGCTTKNAGGLCVHDRFSRFQATPAAERVNSLVSARFKINESTEAFAELLYSHTTTDYNGAFATYGSANPDAVWGDPSTSQKRTFIYRGLPATHPLNTSGEELELRYRFLDDPSYRKSTSDQYRALTGVKGTLANKWEWEAALGIMGGKTKDRSRGGFFSDSGFKEVIGDYNVLNDPQFFNRAYKLGQINSAEVINKLFPVNGYDGKVTQTFIDLKASGQVSNISGRPVMVAVGGDVRHEKIRIMPTANLLVGDIVSNGASSADASRTNESLFAEISAPVLEKLELIGAARFDKFPGFDGRVSPKVAARWQAADNFLLRATLESGFRAPNLTESAPSTKFAFSNSVVDPKRCDQAQALAGDLRDQAAALPPTDPQVAVKLARADTVEGSECAAGVASIVRNNPDLKPETSRSGTVGFVIEPVKGTSFAMDYFRIERKNEINTKNTSELLAAESTLAPGIVNRAPVEQDKTFTAEEREKYGVKVGALQSTSGMFENVSKTRTSGVDLALASRFSLPFGRLDVNGNGTYLLDLRNYAATRNGGSWGDNLAGRYGYSKFTANLLGALTTGAFTNSMRLVYFSPQKLQGDYFDDEYTKEGCAANDWGPGVCRVGSEVRWDYNLSYNGIKNLTLSLNVRNLFDQRPPLDLKAFNSAGGVIPQNLDDVAGRRVRVTAEYRFQ